MATPEFILRLREKIGNDLLWLTGVTAYVADDEGLEVGWFAPDELPSPLAASTEERLNALRAWRGAGASGALFSRGGSEG